MMNKVLKRLKSKKASSMLDLVVGMIIICILIALVMNVYPVFVNKSRIDTFAEELVREAEMYGRIDTETDNRFQRLCEITGITPVVVWSTTGNIQLGNEFTVTVTYTVDIGFGNIGSFPIQLVSEVSGKSEVFWR